MEVKNGLTVEDGNQTPGSIKAEKIGSIQVDAGNLTAQSIIAPGGIDSIEISKGNLTIQGPDGINAIKGNIRRIDVKGDLTGRITEKTGNVSNSFTVGGNFTGGITALTGAIPTVQISGNFTPLTIDSLLSGPSIPSLYVGGTLGGSKTGLSGTIKGDSIGLITAEGDILLNYIEANNGNITSIKSGGILKSTVRAVAGNILIVDAKQVAANIFAGVSTNKGADTTANGGGNIFQVLSKEPILNTVKITAVWYIYKIEVTDDPGNMPEAFTVESQGGTATAGRGAVFVAQGPLIIDLGAGTYLGKVLIRASTAKSIPAAQYTAGATLLTVIDTLNKMQTTTNWTIAQAIPGNNNQNPTTVNALFQKLNTGGFGWVKNKKALSNEVLTIQGPAGNAAN